MHRRIPSAERSGVSRGWRRGGTNARRGAHTVGIVASIVFSSAWHEPTLIRAREQIRSLGADELRTAHFTADLAVFREARFTAAGVFLAATATVRGGGSDMTMLSLAEDDRAAPSAAHNNVQSMRVLKSAGSAAMAFLNSSRS